MGQGAIHDLELGNFKKNSNFEGALQENMHTFRPIFGRSVEQLKVFKYA